MRISSVQMTPRRPAGQNYGPEFCTQQPTRSHDYWRADAALALSIGYIWRAAARWCVLIGEPVTPTWWQVRSLHTHRTDRHCGRLAPAEDLKAAALNPSNAEATLIRPKHQNANIFENHLNPVMLVFIGKLSLSTLR